jgi:hypothetical protein
MDPGLVREDKYVEGTSEQVAEQTARATKQWRSRRRGRWSRGSDDAVAGETKRWEDVFL